MLNSIAHIYVKKSVIRFKRWSHKAYAIFSSIGKQIHIGELSGIIQSINTVKSSLVQEAIRITVDFSVKDEGREEIILTSGADIIDDSLISKMVVYSNVNATRASVAVNECHINIKILKAFFGPFLFSDKDKSDTVFLRGLYFKKQKSPN